MQRVDVALTLRVDSALMLRVEAALKQRADVSGHCEKALVSDACW